MPVYRLEIESRADVPDALAIATRTRMREWLHVSVPHLRTRKIYHLDYDDMSAADALRVLAALVDPVAEKGVVGNLPDESDAAAGAPIVVTIGFAPGVTDSVGRSVHAAIEDCLGRPMVGHAYSAKGYLFWGLPQAEVERCVRETIFNPLIERMNLAKAPRELDLSVPRAGDLRPVSVGEVRLVGATDEVLREISSKGMLALTLAEMRAVERHFHALGRNPKDAELECIAQTWSEHCKHKIFASPIHYRGPDGEGRMIERGLFRQYIRAATERVAAERSESGIDAAGEGFLVSVFHDNAGVVRFTEADHLVYKVETHNSPSALDPYGGAMTGIVGVNRDSFGTGRGADLLTNTWGYCFGPSDYDGKLPSGLMHPRRIREGVHAGVIDGGNHSGIPYSRGFELFEERYVGKPLVYCGTVAAMPTMTAGEPTEQKFVEVGDLIVMVGGRIGKDGIHGATFSSVRLDSASPVQAVQIGDPIIQKMMWDMLKEARTNGLYSGFTDNGAGGLSSSVGEMAGFTNGARIDLAKAPLKYPGLAPWEILISEAQERMTVAVRPQHIERFLALAKSYEVEATVLGEFTNTGRLEVYYGEQVAVDLELAFLHDGVPLPVLEAAWQPPVVAGKQNSSGFDDLSQELPLLLRRPNLVARDRQHRAYDHEVKGLSVVKPYVGVQRDVPACASVMRVRHGRHEGVVLSEGIFPTFSDFDTYAMAQACVDDAVRRALCVGARIDRLSALDNFCWPDPVESDRTPDGKHKLAQLVRCCEGLYDACVGYGVPLISGKDSMKNDAYFDGVKISIPPTLLVSVMGQMADVRRVVPQEPQQPGDRLYLIGSTRKELGGSEWALARGIDDAVVPQTSVAQNYATYRRFAAARDAGLVASAVAVSRGGLAVALAHQVLASGLSIDVDLGAVMTNGGLTLCEACFSESTGRLLVSVSQADQARFEAAMAGSECLVLGEVASSKTGLQIRGAGGKMSVFAIEQLRAAFQEKQS